MTLLTARCCYHISRHAIKTTGRFTLPSQNIDTQWKLKSSNSSKNKEDSSNFPVRPLEDTMKKFMQTIVPLLTKEELAKTKKLADDFVRDKGKDLQDLLQKAACSEENWLAPRWLNVAYLQSRLPVTVYTSPAQCFPLTTLKGPKDQALYTGKWIYGIMKFKNIVDSGQLPIVKMGGKELDNSQFGMVLGTNREPHFIKDKLAFNPCSKHAVVIYKNHFFKFPLYASNDKILHPQVYASMLTQIMDSEVNKGPEFGLLTTDNRDNWAAARIQLLKHEGNRKSVEVIEKALFVVCLDECVSAACGHELDVLGSQLVHGGGVKHNSANRWMDKTIQLIVNSNGISGFAYEHSPAEGQAIASICDYVLENWKNDKHYEEGEKNDCPPVCKLRMEMTKCVEQWIHPARRNINALACNMQFNVLHYENYGKNFIKNHKMSPDSFIQMAMQLAYYKQHGKPAAHYESAHLRLFKNSRTETIRSCSTESVDFAKAMLGKAADKERVDLLRKAVNGHSAYAKMAMQFNGVDRHLFGLKQMALENCLPLHKFFNSPGVLKSSYFRLSTSQVASNYFSFMCYGPAVRDGYSLCYNPRLCDIIIAIGSWKNNDKTDGLKLMGNMRNSLDSMWEVLCRFGEQEAEKKEKEARKEKEKKSKK